MLIDLSVLSVAEKQHWLQHAIAPRPIAFASTIDANGNANLSPFSFFNLFSCQPPVIIFSPARRGRDNTIKHTLENVREVPEVVINICDESMVQQVSLSSCEFPRETDEFIKAGFTAEKATLIRPPMVKESKVKLECRVMEVKSLGEQGGAGQLVIAEVLCMHVDESILGEDGKIDQRKLHHIARLGGNWYCVVNGQNLFEVDKPNTELGIGVDTLPHHIRNSTILTGNHLGRLANVQSMPGIDPFFEDDLLRSIIHYFSVNPAEMERELHMYAAKLLNENKVREAWQVLLTAEN